MSEFKHVTESSESSSETLKVVSFASLAKAREERILLQTWREFYSSQSHENLLQALVHEHENNFPLRRSLDVSDQLRHKALVEILQTRAQTHFLKSFLEEVESRGLN